MTVPVLICGLLTCLLVEKLRWFGYGETLPEKSAKYCNSLTIKAATSVPVRIKSV